MDTVLLIHVAATWAMVGLIWFVQVVHYPLFVRVGPTEFVDYELAHTRRTAFVVALFMPIEAVTGAWLVLSPPASVDRGVLVAGLVLLILLWVSTASWQAPMHTQLSRGYDAAIQRRLVSSNWLRTAVWSGRGALVLVATGQALG